MAPRKLEPSSFLQAFAEIPRYDRYWIGVSGGMDSSALLHLMWATREHHQAEIKVIHVNHGLQKNSQQWQDHVAELCDKLDIEFVSHIADKKPESGESIENWARQLRLQVFQQYVTEHDCLLLAHHQNDQAETLLLQLFRGAGIPGLAAMPLFREHQQLAIGRPLISFNKQQIEQYMRAENITWVEDDSNEDNRFDRNFIRNQIMPMLEHRWPSIEKTLARSSLHHAEAQDILVATAQEQLEECYFDDSSAISIVRLQQYSSKNQNNILRYWIMKHTEQYPTTKTLEEISKSVIASDIESQPVIKIKKYLIRRYLNALFISPDIDDTQSKITQSWQGESPLKLATGILSIKPVTGHGIKKQLIETGVTIRYREPGDKIKQINSKYHLDLKTIFQNHKILPWMRSSMPLLAINNALICIPGICVADSATAEDKEEGYLVQWQPYQDLVYPEHKNR